MNPQSRVNDFLRDLEGIQKKWGIVLVAQLQSELLNGSNGQQVQQTRPVIIPAAVNDWQPSIVNEQDVEIDSR